MIYSSADVVLTMQYSSSDTIKTLHQSLVRWKLASIEPIAAQYYYLIYMIDTAAQCYLWPNTIPNASI